ncbi:MAG TPA: tetratricopeptide repeat protein, partial [Polyangia bacterium]|nr:tetratricopeptide repeat protein [Polyangia bacterium]
MGMARYAWVGALSLVIALGTCSGAAAATRDSDAKQVYEQAMAAFGLGHYAEAAQKYEQAFSLRPDAALLYNAAQSYRLAGNKPRALELYRNCVRLFPSFANADEARGHIATLTREIAEAEKTKAASPPPVVSPPPVASAPAAAPGAAPAPASAAAPAAAPVPSVIPAAPPAAPVLVEAPAASISASAPAPESQKSVFQ